MSFNSHRRKLLDDAEPLEHRASHARSCALHVANKLGVPRETVIKLVAEKSGVNLHTPENVARLLTAFQALEIIRHQGNEADI
jgi:hypothetical protein